MKKLLFFLFTVNCLLLTVSAQPTDWFSARSVHTELNVSSQINIVPIGPAPFVDNLQADLLFVPKNSEFSAVRSFKAAPPAQVLSDRIRYSWSKPYHSTLTYEYSAVVETANNAPRVRAKIPFPVETIRGFEMYTRPTEHVDSTNAAVIAEAVRLSQGEDDLFVVVTKIGSWVKNEIKYNLSSLTADVSQPASWVLENRYGVCDELTSLFIAMLRSLNIPAKFVSGVAFTESSEFPQGWGAHGWAEVYFPGVGWVPFDVTFAEFGWTDPGHMKLYESLDPQDPTSLFQWKSRDVNVFVHDLLLSADVLRTEGKVDSELRLSAYPLKDRVGFDSYNTIVLDVENLADYYVGVEFTLASVVGVTIVGESAKQIALPPRRSARLAWLVKINERLDKHFQYNVPINVYTIKNESAKSSFGVGKWDIVFSESELKSSIEQLTKSEKDAFDLACSFEEDRIWTSEGVLNCELQNRQEVDLVVRVCFDVCDSVLVPAKQTMPKQFKVLVSEAGKHDVDVVATTGDIIKRATLSLIRLDRPIIAVHDVSAPEVVQYGEAFGISLSLSRESTSFPQNVSVSIFGGGSSAVIDVGELVLDQEIRVNVRSDQLISSSPDFDIVVSYSDPFGKGYSVREDVSVKVN
ncbi:hypothetical protein COV18_00885, partial [Candidatus Woesearchaeota archaeon CG10_big_fil_rev_8_21_14_0_10_37_12]